MALAARLAPCLLLACGACAHFSQEDGERLASEVYTLTTQLQALQKSVTEAQRINEGNTQQIAELSQQVQAFSKFASGKDADFGVQLDQTLEELARLRGVVEGSKERFEALESQLSRMSDLADAQRKQSEVSQEEQRARERVLDSPTQVMAEASRLISGGKPAEARRLLREFSQRAEGTDKQKQYGDAIQFLLAETYFAEGSYQLAATEYNGLRKNHPKSSKVPDALFKMGQCFERLKLPEDAKLFYKTVVEKHPKSSAARHAKERLKDLR